MNPHARIREPDPRARADRVSVIVPVLDEESEIATTLFGLQRARIDGAVEVIVVDGGSRDGTVGAARPLADAVLDAPRGRALQMNAGAAAATGRVLLFLHADTRLPSGWMACVREAIGAGSRWGRFDLRIEGNARILGLVAVMMNLRSRWTGICTGDQAIFACRESFSAVGGYPAIPLMEDIALSKLLKRTEGRPACLSLRATTSGRRWEHDGPWKTIVRMWKLRLLYFLGVDPERLAADWSEPRTGEATP